MKARGQTPRWEPVRQQPRTSVRSGRTQSVALGSFGRLICSLFCERPSRGRTAAYRSAFSRPWLAPAPPRLEIVSTSPADARHYFVRGRDAYGHLAVSAKSPLSNRGVQMNSS